MLGNIFKGKNNFSPQPKIGERIKITWLPFNNGYPNPNCYIGSVGIVDYLYDNGGFCLNMGGSILCVTRNKFKYEILDENN